MANRDKGEVALQVNGTTYRLVLNTGAMASLEDHYSTPDHEATWDEVWARITKGSVRAIRSLIWAMAQTHHPGLTIEDAGRLIDEVGGLQGLTDVLTVSATSTQPDPEDSKALGLDRPPKAQARRSRGRSGGGVYTSMHGASA